MVYLGHNKNNSRKDFTMTNAAFLAELRDAARINEMEDQRAEMLDAVREASEEAELSDFDPHRDFYAEMDDEPVMHLPNDLYMIFDDPDYFG